MTLRLNADGLRTIRSSADAIVLGIILDSGLVVLRIGDAATCPGHVAWTRAHRITNATRGFSLMVRAGRVTAMYLGSELNPTVDRQLELEYVEQIERLLSDDLDGSYCRW